MRGLASAPVARHPLSLAQSRQGLPVWLPLRVQQTARGRVCTAVDMAATGDAGDDAAHRFPKSLAETSSETGLDTVSPLGSP